MEARTCYHAVTAIPAAVEELMPKPASYARTVAWLLETRGCTERQREIAETLRPHLLGAQQADRAARQTELMRCAEEVFAWGCAFKKEPETEKIWRALANVSDPLVPIMTRHAVREIEHAGQTAKVECHLLIDPDPTDDERLFVFRQWIDGVLVTSDGRLTTVHGLYHEVNPFTLIGAARVIKDDGQVYKNIEAYLKNEIIRLASGH
jgi:hypothetical protein